MLHLRAAIKFVNEMLVEKDVSDAIIVVVGAFAHTEVRCVSSLVGGEG